MRRARQRGEPIPLDPEVQCDLALPVTDWAMMPGGAVRTWFRAGSGELATISLGDRAQPRVVLVPGATGSKEDFALVMPLLVRAGYFVQSFDLAGQFESHAAGPERGAPYDWELFIADLIAFLEDGPPAHVVGYSFAGLVSQLVLVRRPELFRSLTLLSSPPLAGQVFRGVRWVGVLSWLCPPRIAAGLIIWGIVTNKNRVDENRIAFVRSRFALTRRSSVDDIMRLMKHTPDVGAQVRDTGIRVLVVVGQHDLWPMRQHRRHAATIGARMVAYRTGHSPCETTPHQFSRNLLELYRSVDG